MGQSGAGEPESIGGGGAAPTYFLTPHSFACRVDGILIFLDLKGDDYVCLEPGDSDSVGRLLGLLPARDGATGPPPVEALIEAGLITADARSGKPATPPAKQGALRELPGFDIDSGPRAGARHVAALLKGYVIARTLLGLAPLERVVRRVARRRARNGGRADPERARELVEIYRRLRPLVMSRKDRCLLNTLLLIEFLAAFGVYPSWRFGVKLRPFSAHCWVQDGDLLYEEDVEIVAKYSLIMKA